MRSLRAAARPAAKATLVTLVALAVLTAVPMSSPTVEGARVCIGFSDGSQEPVIIWTTPPAPGEMTTLYFSIKADVTVVSAQMSVAGVLFNTEDSFTATGNLGTKVDASGDINGDGYDDLIITAPEAGTSVSGILHILLGDADGPDTPANATINGAANDRIGYGLSTTGDLNGDGYDEIVVGGPQVNAAGAFVGPGVAYVYLGGDTINTTVAATLSEGADGDYYAWSISTAGDINKDGYDDIVLGAPQLMDTTNPGKVYVYLGSDTGPSTSPDITITGDDNGDGYGSSVAIVGDVNDDGYDDVLVGAPGANGTMAADWDVGRLYLYYGNDNGINTTADWSYDGVSAGDGLGNYVARAGDVNGDGFYDLLAGAPFVSISGMANAGSAYLFYGGSSGPSSSPDVTWEGEATDELMGWSLSGVGDANDDGYDDITIAAPQATVGGTQGAGYFQVHMGGPNGIGQSAATVKRGTRQGEFLGRLMGPGGDVNGDGFDDLVSGNWPNVVAAHVYYGEGGPLSPRIYLDTTLIWSKTGNFGASDEIPDFSALISAYMAAHQHEIDGNGNISIPVNITSSGVGRLRLYDVSILYYKLNAPKNLDASPLARGNAVQLTWDPQTGDDTSALALEMWNGTGWEEVKKLPRLNTSHVVEGLEDGVEYEFRLRAYDGAVQRYSDPSGTVKVTPMDTKPPARVINVTAKGVIADKGINVTWDASDPDTVNYELWSNKTGAWAVLANLTAPQNWYLDTDIDDGPKYYYRVRAWDEVPLVGEVSATVSGFLPDTTGPATPTGVAVAPLPEGNALRITWDLNDDDTVSYSLQSNKTGDWREVARLLRTVGEHVDRGLMDGNTYWYRVYAIDESSNPSDYSSPVSGVPEDTTPPAIPQGVTASPRSQGNTLRLEWAPNADDTEFYQIYLYNTSSSAWEMVGKVAASVTQYDAINLLDGTSYRLRVTALDEAGLESDASDEASGVPRDTLFPIIPTGLKITVIPEGKALNLSWSENMDDTVSYKIYRFEEGTWLMVAEVDSTTTWFLDTGLTNNVRYPYVITAIDEVGNESPFSTRVEEIPIDSVPPLRPNFSQLPSRTRIKDVTVSGICEPFAKITMHVNKLAQTPVDCDALGAFSVDIRLRSGSNEVYAVADDGSGYTTESERVTIYVDETPPVILSISPANGETQVERELLTITLVFREDIVSEDLEMVLVKGKETDMAKLLAKILLGEGVVPCELISYIRTDLRATFNVTQMLDRSSTYTVVVMGVKDIAGNPMETEADLGLWTSAFSTEAGGPVGPTEDDGDGGISSLVLGAVAAVIIIIVVIIVAIFIMRAGARGETVEVERRVVEGPPPEPTAEELRPDVQSLYQEAYQERGEEPQEKHEVDAGLGSWLAEQERASQEADEETKRLVEEMAKQPGPPVESGPIEEVPPGLVEHRVTMDEEEAAPEGEAPEGEAPEDKKPEGEAPKDETSEGSEGEAPKDEKPEDEKKAD